MQNTNKIKKWCGYEYHLLHFGGEYIYIFYLLLLPEHELHKYHISVSEYNVLQQNIPRSESDKIERTTNLVIQNIRNIQSEFQQFSTIVRECAGACLSLILQSVGYFFGMEFLSCGKWVDSNNGKTVFHRDRHRIVKLHL